MMNRDCIYDMCISMYVYVVGVKEGYVQTLMIIQLTMLLTMLLAGNIEQLCFLYRALSELRVLKIYQ